MGGECEEDGSCPREEGSQKPQVSQPGKVEKGKLGVRLVSRRVCRPRPESRRDCGRGGSKTVPALVCEIIILASKVFSYDHSSLIQFYPYNSYYLISFYSYY